MADLQAWDETAKLSRSVSWSAPLSSDVDSSKCRKSALISFSTSDTESTQGWKTRSKVAVFVSCTI